METKKLMSAKSERLLKIYGLLKRGPISVEILKHWAEKNNIKISERTFYRDLIDLENALMLPDEKLIVSVGEKNKKVWKIEYQSKAESLDDFDINSYLLFKNFLPFPVVSARKSSLNKILNLFYGTYSKSKFENFVELADRQIAGTHFYEASDIQNYNKILEDSLWSIQNKREMLLKKINYDYTSIASHVKFPMVFLPLQLLYHRGVVHVCGFIKNEKELVILALEQFKSYKLTNKMFDNRILLDEMDKELMKRFGIPENINNEIYNIEIEFSQLTGIFVKNQFWHSTQEIIALENGNYLMKLRCGINRELVGWIFQWMSNVKVQKPQILKDIVVDKYLEVIDSYKNDTSLISNNSFRSE